MNRRDFLRPRRLAAAAGEVLGLVDELTRPETGEADQASMAVKPGEAALIRFARRAMATVFEIIIPFGTPDAHEAAEVGLDEIDRLEAQLTVYRDTSEMSRLNHLAPYTGVRVEEGLFDLLRTAARLHQESEGAFDVSAGALIKAWGFFKGPRRVPSETERTEVLAQVGMQHVVLEESGRAVRYLRPGLEINLGSIGKGYALDRVADILREGWKIPSALLHGGHSSIYAIGNAPGEKDGWSIALRHPWDPEKRLGTVRLRDRALGTSAATFRYLEHEGRKLGHVLDPRTGWPAEGVASVSVLAPTAAEADALATAFFIQGPLWAQAYCQAHPGIGAILLAEGENAVPVVFGLAPEEIELTPPSPGNRPG
jgi:FAD:protein FMN transferase